MNRNDSWFGIELDGNSKDLAYVFRGVLEHGGINIESPFTLKLYQGLFKRQFVNGAANGDKTGFFASRLENTH